MDDAFLSAAPDREVLFKVAVTKAWLRQVIVGLALICHSSYRGVVELVRDLLGLSISVGTVHHVLQSATRQASAINRDQDLSGIRVGLHDEILQGATPVLAGVDAASTPTAICWRRSTIVTPTPGAYTCWMPPCRGSILTIRSPMPGKACAPGRRPPGATRTAIATCSTSSVIPTAESSDLSGIPKLVWL